MTVERQRVEGRFGAFIACSNYPTCKYTQPKTIPGIKCPKCGEMLTTAAPVVTAAPAAAAAVPPREPRTPRIEQEPPRTSGLAITSEGALVLHTLRYHDEIVPKSDLGDLPKASDLPKKEVEIAERLIDAAISYRDKCILTLLFRTAQRIGDWNDLAGRHGVRGIELADIDEKRGTITVRLKGDRDEHRVPVTDDFWPLFHRYLADERGTTATTTAAWLSMRKGKGKPLSYATFECLVRYISRKIGVKVHLHVFRHTLAQAVLETTGNLKVAQELLGHAQLSTTADLYMHVDEPTLVKAVAAVSLVLWVAAIATGRWMAYV